MLELTQNTIDAVNDLATDTETSGLRIFGRESKDEFVLSALLVEQPEDGDEIVEHGGARVYLAETVVPMLANKRLDAVVSDGRLRLNVLA